MWKYGYLFNVTIKILIFQASWYKNKIVFRVNPKSTLFERWILSMNQRWQIDLESTWISGWPMTRCYFNIYQRGINIGCLLGKNWFRCSLNARGPATPGRPGGCATHPSPPPPPFTFLSRKKKKERQRQKRKGFKAEIIKRLSPRSNYYCFSHSRASRIQKFFLSINHGGQQYFPVFHGPTTFKSISPPLCKSVRYY